MFAITQNMWAESREGFLEEGMAKLKDEGREAFFRPKKERVQGPGAHGTGASSQHQRTALPAWRSYVT